MKRNVGLEEISDGRLYGRNDMVKAGCGDCKGCSSCCHDMGNSVILDPMDVYRLTGGLGRAFGELLNDCLELNVVDGIILPNLKMNNASLTCAFLNEEGRCSIHSIRPGICRLFPLGRYYEKEKRSFRYFLQVHECPAPNKTKVKVEKWMDTPNLAKYERYINEWHYFLEDVETILQDMSNEQQSQANLYVLKLFFMKAYDPSEDFYAQFEDRLQQAREVFA